MIDAHLLRTLQLAGSPNGAGPRHLSAASGLALCGQHLYVVADDELGLGVFALEGDAPGHLHPLFDGELPTPHAARKAAKPDLEALTVLPPFAGHPFGALWAPGSGSTPGRHRAALLRLDEQGGISGPPAVIDLQPLYAPLHARFGDLNIEGAFVCAGALCLLQRGHRGARANACIRFAWPQCVAWLRGSGPAPEVASIEVFDLGELDGVPLGFTDGAAWPGGGWVFSAAAEDTASSYADGRCAGSAVGWVSAEGQLRNVTPLAVPCKAEGIAVVADGSELGLWLVTDADDRHRAAQLLSVPLPHDTLAATSEARVGRGSSQPG